jgi:hypothetical protein
MKAKKTNRNRLTKPKSRSQRYRPKMPPTSEDMKHWSAMLGEEMKGWPQVTSRPMFGMLGFYRRKKIFGALPVTRGFGTANSFMLRFDPMPPELKQRAFNEPRIPKESLSPKSRWSLFEIGSTEDLRDALWWLNQAYERAN